MDRMTFIHSPKFSHVVIEEHITVLASSNVNSSLNYYVHQFTDEDDPFLHHNKY